MGFPEDVMRGFVSKEIHIRFPHCEGWDTQQVKSDTNGGFVYQVSRNYRGKKQYALISASFDQKPTPLEIPRAKASRSDRHVSIGSFLLVPQGADTSGVPTPVGVLPMSSFGFIGRELVWLTKKKNAQEYPLKVAAEQ
jgi:hypothetical protein